VTVTIATTSKSVEAHVTVEAEVKGSPTLDVIPQNVVHSPWSKKSYEK